MLWRALAVLGPGVCLQVGGDAGQEQGHEDAVDLHRSEFVEDRFQGVARVQNMTKRRLAGIEAFKWPLAAPTSSRLR